MVKLKAYSKRSVEFIKLANAATWRLKVYGINIDGLPLSSELVASVLRIIPSYLPQPAMTEQRYGVGFLIIHRGSLRNWVLLDWWESQDIMHHRLFSSPLNDEHQIIPEPDHTIVACVHELRVINFESKAWITCALSPNSPVDIDMYLNCRMSE